MHFKIKNEQGLFAKSKRLLKTDIQAIPQCIACKHYILQMRVNEKHSEVTFNHCSGESTKHLNGGQRSGKRSRQGINAGHQAEATKYPQIHINNLLYHFLF